MTWWFRASNHEVKIVVLAKFDRDQQKVLLEKYEEEPQSSRPGAMTTRSVATLVPVLQQEIEITRNTATNPISFNVTRGALVLTFRKLFLRDPGPGERDIIIDVTDLQYYAHRVWVAQP